MKMALARALHHSAQPAGPVVEEPEEEVEFEEHAGLRAQNTPPPGSRPGVLTDPGPSWVEAVTVGYVAAGAPSLVVAPVAAHDGLDDATVQFLLQQSLLARAQEEEEAREREEVELLEEKVKEKVKEKERRIVEEIDRLRSLGENDRSPLLFRTCGWYVARRNLLAKKEKMKRKRKKRRKRRTPRTSSLPGRACRRDLRRQFHLLFPVQVHGKGRSEQWEVFLYCDMTIKVDRDYAEVLPWGVPLFDIGGVGFGSSPILDTLHTIFELCPPSERGCVVMSCGGGFFSPDGAYDSVWDGVRPLTGKYALLFPVPRGCWVCLHAEWQVQHQRHYLRRQLHLLPVHVAGLCRSKWWEVYLYGDSWFKLKGQLRSEKWEVYPYGDSRFKLKGQLRSEKWEVHLYGDSRFKLQDLCRSVKWEVYLHGDKTIQVVCAHVQFLASGYMPVVVTTRHVVKTCSSLRSSPQLQVLA